jgi:hypothetical protein
MKFLPKFWRDHFLKVEFGIALLATAGLLVYGERFGGRPCIHAILDGNRSAIYATVASLAGSLLGFVLAAASIILTFANSDRLALLRQSRHYPTIWKIFKAAMRALAFATVAAVVALLVDRDRSPAWWLVYVNSFTALWAGLRLWRCLWIFNKIVAILTGPNPARAGSEP